MKKWVEGTYGALLDDAMHPIVKAENLKRGQIVMMKMTREDGLVLKAGSDSHYKRFVIIGTTSDGEVVGVNLINTKMNGFSEASKACQVLLKKSDYDLSLDYDSWLDCSYIFSLDKDKILEMGRNHGELLDEDLKKAMTCLRETVLISDDERERFGLLD